MITYKIPQKKERNIKADLTKKTGKYFLARQKGMTKSEAAISLGMAPTGVANIEATKNYQACVKKYGDVLREKIALEMIAEEQIKNIMQDTDKGAKNVAIKQAMDRIEPQQNEEFSSGEINIIIRPRISQN